MEKITRREKVRNRTKKYQTNKQTNQQSNEQQTTSKKENEGGGAWQNGGPHATHTHAHTLAVGYFARKLFSG